MPIYGYECNKCGTQFETLQRADETVSCPKCASAKVERMLSRVAPSPRSGEMAAPASCPAAFGGPSCGNCSFAGDGG